MSIYKKFTEIASSMPLKWKGKANVLPKISPLLDQEVQITQMIQHYHRLMRLNNIHKSVIFNFPSVSRRLSEVN